MNWPFIPCLGNGNKLVKYNDRPYYPHDMDIANLFADILPIIKLPGEMFYENNDHCIQFH